MPAPIAPTAPQALLPKVNRRPLHHPNRLYAARWHRRLFSHVCRGQKVTAIGNPTIPAETIPLSLIPLAPNRVLLFVLRDVEHP